MNLGDKEKSVLVGLYNDTRRIAAKPELPGYGHGRERAERRDAEAGRARVNAAEWLSGVSSASRSVMASRSYKRLEEAGFIVRCRLGFGNNTTHLQLTEAGRRLAEQLSQQKETK